MVRRPAWTKDDKAALQRLVGRYGAPAIRKRLEASARDRGRPPGATCDALGVWKAVECLMRRDGIGKTEACTRLAEIARVNVPGETGYGPSSLGKFHNAGIAYFGKYPAHQKWANEEVDRWVAMNAGRADVVYFPLVWNEGGLRLWADDAIERWNKLDEIDRGNK